MPLLALALVLAAAPSPKPAAYDPLRVADVQVAIWDGSISDAARHREIPVRVYLPQDTRAAPVVLYSHGLGGSRETSAFLGQHWAKRGYLAVFMQHPGSDTSVWSDKAPAERMDALKKAA